MSGDGNDCPAPIDDGRRVLSLAAVTMAAFGVGLSFGIAFPLTSLTLESWQTSKFLIGLAGAAPSVSVLLVLPLVPRIVRRLGIVSAIVVGCAFGALGFLGLSQFQSAEAWIAIRFLMSAGLALPWLAGETWVNLVSAERTRGRVIAIYAISFFSGYSAGPLILDVTGITGIRPFIAGALSMGLAGLPILIARNLAPSVADAGGRFSITEALRMAPAGMAGGFIGGFAEMSYLSLLPNVALAGGLDQGKALWLMSLMTFGGVMLQYPIGWLVDKVAKLRVTVSLAVLFVGLTIALPFGLALGLAPFIAFALGGVILGFYSVGLAIVGEDVPPEHMTAANAAFLMFYQCGAIIGPAACGAAMTRAPVEGFVAVLSLIMLVSVGALVVAMRSLSRNS